MAATTTTWYTLYEMAQSREGTTMFSKIPIEVLVLIVRLLSPHSLRYLLLAEPVIRRRCLLITDEFSHKNACPGLFTDIPGVTKLQLCRKTRRSITRLARDSYVIKLMDLTFTESNDKYSIFECESSLFAKAAPKREPLPLFLDDVTFVHIRGDPRLILSDALELPRLRVFGPGERGEKILLESMYPLASHDTQLKHTHLSLIENLMPHTKVIPITRHLGKHLLNVHVHIKSGTAVGIHLPLTRWLKIELMDSGEVLPQVGYLTAPRLRQLVIQYTGRLPRIHHIEAGVCLPKTDRTSFEITNTEGFISAVPGPCYIDSVTKKEDYEEADADTINDYLRGLGAISLCGVPEFWVHGLDLSGVTTLAWKRTVRHIADEDIGKESVKLKTTRLQHLHLWTSVAGLRIPKFVRSMTLMWMGLRVFHNSKGGGFETLMNDFLDTLKLEPEWVKVVADTLRDVEISSISHEFEERLVMSRALTTRLLSHTYSFRKIVLNGVRFGLHNELLTSLPTTGRALVSEKSEGPTLLLPDGRSKICCVFALRVVETPQYSGSSAWETYRLPRGLSGCTVVDFLRYFRAGEVTDWCVGSVGERATKRHLGTIDDCSPETGHQVIFMKPYHSWALLPKMRTLEGSGVWCKTMHPILMPPATQMDPLVFSLIDRYN